MMHFHTPLKNDNHWSDSFSHSLNWEDWLQLQVADLVEEKTNDTIGFFDEESGKFEEDWIKHV